MSLGIGIGLAITRGQGVGAPLDPIGAYFATGNNGFDFDFSKTDQLFQTSSGEAAVTDAGQNIGLALDAHAWGGRTYAQELAQQTPLINDDFTSGISGWTSTNGLSTLTNPSGVLRITNDSSVSGNGDTIGKTVTTVVGVRYTVVFAITDSVANGRIQIGTSFPYANNLQGGIGSGARTVIASFIATGTSTRIMWNFRSGTPGQTCDIDSVVVTKVDGNHGSQTLSNSRPQLQSDGIARSDGSDDGLATGKLMGAGGFVMVKQNAASPPGSSKILCGASGSSTAYGYCGMDSDGHAVARVGTGAVMTSDAAVTGGQGTLGFWWDGSTAGLLVDGVKVKTQAQSGAPTTSIPLALFCLNGNGTLANFLGTDGYRFIHGDTAPDDATLLSFHNRMMAA